MPSKQPSGCLLALVKIFGSGPSKSAAEPTYPYVAKKYLLTMAERSFYEALRLAVNEELHIFAKVRLCDLVDIPKGTEKRQSHFNRIQSKHVDFVLCDRRDVCPVLAIELDDSSHQRAARQSRDHFVESALEAAGLPLLRIRAARGYSVPEIASQISEKRGRSVA